MELEAESPQPQQPPVEGQPPLAQLPSVPGRTTPGFAFSILDRAISECLSRQQFGAAEVKQVIDFFGGNPLECAFCGAIPVTRWDHLIPIHRGGETILGNMVPACGPCDDSKQHRPYEVWMLGEGQSSLKSRGVADVGTRLERLRAYVQHFGYSPCPLNERLTAEELARLTAIRAKLHEARSDLEALIVEYRRRTGHV